MTAVEHFLKVKNKLGEGPLWHVSDNALYWVDIEGECFFRYFPDVDQLERFPVGQPIGCLAFCADGKLLLALRDGLGFWNWENNTINIIKNPEEGRKNARFNDGRVDSQGRFWAGTLGDDQNSRLYRLDPNYQLQSMESGIMISNGLGWSPDDTILYYTDSPRRIIYAYDFDSAEGIISNRRIFVRVPEDQGVPDGLIVDQEGFIWSAHWDGWRISRYDPAGKVERIIYLPVQRPTSCCLGGPDLDLLFITSAWTGLSGSAHQHQPLAGDLFYLPTDHQGQPEHVFGS